MYQQQDLTEAAPGAAAGDVGAMMYAWARALFPINRSLTGPGVRETLAWLAGLLPGFEIRAVPSGTRVLDWVVPDEWTLRDAYIADESGRRVVDFQQCNLHVVGYSEPVDCWLTRQQLDAHLHSLPDQPTAIPYVTSYYSRSWGFCLSHTQRQALPEGRYHVVIDSDLSPGVLNYGELVLPGQTAREILLSTNVCHPSMGNNETSGIVVTAALAQWAAAAPRRYTYRFVFIPETIGALAYMAANGAHLKQHVDAGFTVTCVGDDRTYSYVPSRAGYTLADRVALHVLNHRAPGFKHYSFLERGSDERQYCSPGMDLPVCSITRSKHVTYPEYHTSLDDLSLISPAGLAGAFQVLRSCLEVLEANHRYRVTTVGEPQLGRRGLYPPLNSKANKPVARPLLDICAYADGTRDLISLAEVTGQDALECAGLLELLRNHGLVEIVDSPA